MEFDNSLNNSLCFIIEIIYFILFMVEPFIICTQLRAEINIDLLCFLYLQLALTILYIAGGVFAAGWIGKQRHGYKI